MRKERIKRAIKAAFTTGVVIGSIVGSIIGYCIGAGKLQLPEQKEQCYAKQCNCKDIWGNPVSYNNYHCGVHGHECSYGE